MHQHTFTAVAVITEFVSCIAGAVVTADCVMTMHFTMSIVGRTLIYICYCILSTQVPVSNATYQHRMHHFLQNRPCKNNHSCQ